MWRIIIDDSSKCIDMFRIFCKYRKGHCLTGSDTWFFCTKCCLPGYFSALFCASIELEHCKCIIINIIDAVHIDISTSLLDLIHKVGSIFFVYGKFMGCKVIAPRFHNLKFQITCTDSGERNCLCIFFYFQIRVIYPLFLFCSIPFQFPMFSI